MEAVDCLVVGGGYLGERVARAWSAQGLRVAITTRSAEKGARFRDLGWQPLLCDLLQPDSLTALPAAGLILHAVAKGRDSTQSPRELAVTGLRNLLQALPDTHADAAPHLLHISSTSVYGQTDGSWVDETSPTEPERENGQIVLAAEQVLHDSSWSYTILRLAGIYGPQRLLARIAERSAALPVPGNPEAWLNLIHVDDAVAAILRAGALRLRKTLLIADDRPIPRREYYETLARLLDTPPPLFQPDLPDRKGDRGLNKRIRNHAMHTHLQLPLQYPTLIEGLPHALGSSATTS